MSDERPPEAMPLRVLIVDDERLARLRLEDLLGHEPAVEIVGSARNGVAAVEAIRALRPDVVFLDVQMPGMTGLDVVREIGAAEMPLTIFVTAFDQYALAAFDVAAMDYLVKPFVDARFAQALERARRRLALEGIELYREQLLVALQRARPVSVSSVSTPEAPYPSSPALAELPATGSRAAPTFVERIAIEMRGKVRAVQVAEIDYITASGSYAELHVAGRAYIIRETMQALEKRLDPSRFMRVHRSVIVRLELVEMLHRSPGGDYEVQLRGGVRLGVSRSRHETLVRWLGLTP